MIDPTLLEYARPLLKSLRQRPKFYSLILYQENGEWKHRQLNRDSDPEYLLNPTGLFIDGNKINLETK